MPRIHISEVDNTLNTSDEILSNVVYIPGFSKKGSSPIKSPVLIQSVSAFTEMFGTSAPTFDIEQPYPIDFSANARSEDPMFTEGAIDPSYTIALQLLANGIPVVYERVNDAASSTIIYPSTPGDETVDPSIGFIHGEEGFEDIAPSATTAPTDTTASINTEIYVQVLSATEGSEPWIYKYYLYKGSQEASSVISYIWEDVTNRFCFEPNAVDASGIPATLTSYSISVNTMYAYLSERFKYALDNPLYDRNAFNIKYLTTGGYPVFEYNNNAIVDDMLECASPLDNSTGRGDCIVLIDHTNNPNRPLTGDTSVFHEINGDYKISSNWAAMITPWFTYGSYEMPGSFAYLISLASAINTNPNWLAIAGTNRGVIPGATGLLVGNNLMTRAIADSYMIYNNTESTRYSTFINPIVNVNPYGLTIWGNRTLADTAANSEEALYYLNMRSLVAEIKKRCYAAAEQLMFEQNSDVLWINFKSKITPLLDEMSSSYGISGYQIIKEVSDSDIQLKATIKVFPIYAVEDFDITVMLTSEEVDINEE